MPDAKRGHRRQPRRSGMALLVVVVLVMLISLGAYRYSFNMESQYRLTRLNEEQVHARLAALSGLELATAIVELPAGQRTDLGGLIDNPAVFRHVGIDAMESSTGESDRSAWRFSLVAPRMNDQANENASSRGIVGSVSIPIRFGLENESAKIHIPTLLAWDRARPGHARATLMSLPGMNETTIDAWLNELGVSNGTDRVLVDHTASVDDLRKQWFGGDLNQNYQLDALELRFATQHMLENGAVPQSTNDTPRPSGSDGASNAVLALQRYLTWYSGSRNVSRLGAPRIHLNDPDLRTLHQKLSAIWSPEWANFVIAMRQFGPVPVLGAATSTSSGLNLPGSGGSLLKPSVGPVSTVPATTANGQAAANAASNVIQDLPPDFSKAAVYTFRSPLDLVGAVIELPALSTAPVPTTVSNSTATTPIKRTLRNPFSSDIGEVRNYLGRVLDDVTVENVPMIEGRIDVTEAPIEVLAAVPGLDLPTATRIVQHRSTTASTSTDPSQADTLAWLLEVVDLTQLKELEPYLTCRSDVYSVQAVGYRDDRSAVYRTTATIDARQIPAQLRNQRIWHPWDRGFPLEQLADTKP